MKHYIETRHKKFITDFETIVNIDSSSDNKGGIERVARFFEDRFKNIGLDTEILFLGENKVPCLYAEHRPSKKPFDIMFMGHMDTIGLPKNLLISCSWDTWIQYFPLGKLKNALFQSKGTRHSAPGSAT
ncbi:MAG: hypothetical protein JRC91_07200 [Deltaproteobacteria bacterium]|nr:hypothetical protein [Deltaproteobacteria bacterium]